MTETGTGGAFLSTARRDRISQCGYHSRRAVVRQRDEGARLGHDCLVAIRFEKEITVILEQGRNLSTIIEGFIEKNLSMLRSSCQGLEQSLAISIPSPLIVWHCHSFVILDGSGIYRIGQPLT